MRDRTVFMNTLGEPNCEDNIPAIFEKHYLKFNYAYELFEHILDFPKIEKNVKKIASDQDDNILFINISFKRGVDLEYVEKTIEDFIEERGDDDIEADVEILPSNKINISISAKFIEEEMYDENRFDSVETVHSN